MRVNRTKLLAEAVADSFEAAGYTPAELLQGQIKITDLPWQAPPLRSEAQLASLPLHEYLDYPYSVDSNKLYEFYFRGIYALRENATDISNPEGYTNLQKVMPGMKAGERNLALYLPYGWPVLDNISGPIFALEVARLFKLSECKGFVEDDSNYYAVTEWGNVGIVDGYTSEFKEGWDVPCHGIVQAMLEQPRGHTTVDCAYDVLARLRSALYEAPDRFVEFEGIDQSLQALRILSNGGLCREAQLAVQQMSMAAFRRKQRLNAFNQCVEVMSTWNMSDRAKISSVLQILVPQHYSMAMFNRKIYDMRRVLPAVLSKKVEDRITNHLKSELKRARDAVKVTRT